MSFFFGVSETEGTTREDKMANNKAKNYANRKRSWDAAERRGYTVL